MASLFVSGIVPITWFGSLADLPCGGFMSIMALIFLALLALSTPALYNDEYRLAYRYQLSVLASGAPHTRATIVAVPPQPRYVPRGFFLSALTLAGPGLVILLLMFSTFICLFVEWFKRHPY
ncbi:hypothetical protein FRC01_000334 [Tulasnella sp. 417]|nr:hypothetical protein FRC01_000334 [Tulasnella sp. 417]